MNSDFITVIIGVFKTLGVVIPTLIVFGSILRNLCKTDVEKKIENNFTKLCRHTFYEILIGLYIIFMSLFFPFFVSNNEKLTSAGVYIAMGYLIIVYLVVDILGDPESHAAFVRLKLHDKAWFIKLTSFTRAHHYLGYGLCLLGCLANYYFLYSLFLSVFNASMHTTFASGMEIVKSTTKDFLTVCADLTKVESDKFILESNRLFIFMMVTSYVISRVMCTPLVAKIKSYCIKCNVEVYLNGSHIALQENLVFLNMNNENYIFEVKGTRDKLMIPKQTVRYLKIK